MRGVKGLVVIVAVLVSLIGCAEPPHRANTDRAMSSRPSAPGATALTRGLPRERTQLVSDLDRAQGIIDDPSSPSLRLASAGRFEQLATVALGHESVRAQRATLRGLGRRAKSSMRSNLAAASALARLVTPHKSLPAWRIVQPPAPDRLLGYFKKAQSRYGVRWEYLAAIEFIETKFGRVHGRSSAGAEGPMQFLPATWKQYGTGNINSPRNAILAAARYLVANGARRDITSALYHYNPDIAYVNAVEDYASLIRATPRAYYGYYYWQVIYLKRGGPVILPEGYPKVPPVSVQQLAQRHL